MLKIICDICKQEPKKEDGFNCEIGVRRIEKPSQLVNGIVEVKPKIVDFRFHLCKNCFGKRLNTLLKDK